MEKMKAKILQSLTLCVTVLLTSPALSVAQTNSAGSQSTSADVTALKTQLSEQQKEIDALKQALEEQKKLIEQNLKAGTTSADKSRPDFALPRDKALGDVASTTPIIPRRQ